MQHCSPRTAALALGVSESTVRRWVDRSEVMSDRTSGGHRRILVADLVRYVREQGLTWDSPDMLDLDAARNDEDDDVERLYDALRMADLPRASGIVVGSFVAGREISDIFDGLVAPAMAQIGELWKGGLDGVLAEHRATSVAVGLIRRLRELHPEPTGTPVVGGAIAGDPYSIPSAMAETLLHGLGHQAFDLGPNTPVQIIAEAARDQGARLAWVSVNHVNDPVTARADLVETLEGHASDDLRFVIGGRALNSLDVPPMPHVDVVESMRDLSNLAAEISAA